MRPRPTWSYSTSHGLKVWWIQKQRKVASTSFRLNCTRNRKPLTVEMEHSLLWIEDCNQKQIPVSLALKLVAALKENGNYKDIYLLPVKAGFLVSEVNMNWLMLSCLVKLQAQIRMLLWNLHSRFQELQAVLALHSSERLLCKKLQDMDGM